MTEEQALGLIVEWNTGRYSGRAFRMLGIWANAELVGTVSLFEDTQDRVSFGIEIVPGFRRKGYAVSATKLAMAEARSLGYHTMISQVRRDNAASIALHEKLGFVMKEATVNSRGREVYLYQTVL